jgi:CheY-like chemotaxis protein
VLKTSAFQIYPAHTITEAETALEVMHPAAIVLDIVLGGMESWDFLVRVRRDDRLRDVPVVIVSALPYRDKGLALGADAYLMKPIDRRTLLDMLAGLHERRRQPLRVLTVDDEDVARYLIRQCLPVPAFEVTEASTAEEGVSRARDERPDAVLLDLVMPGAGGRDALRQLRADPRTAGIPIVIVTSTALDRDEHAALLEQVAAIVMKSDLTRDHLPTVVRRVVERGRATGDRQNSPL